MVSMQPSSAEMLQESDVKAWKECFLTDLHKSRPQLTSPPFLFVRPSNRLFLNDGAISPGHVYVKNIWFLECMYYFYRDRSPH